MKCGISYQGSKSNFIHYLADYFPPATNFYDLFGGGFAVSHYMLAKQMHKYQRIHYNEIIADILILVRDAIAGKYNYDRFKPAWISREEFFARKDTDAYVRCGWSFGNNQKNYLFGKNIEPYKRSMHQAVVFSEFDDLAKEVLKRDSWDTDNIKERRLYLRRIVEQYRKTTIPEYLKPFLSPKQLEQLEQLERLERLQNLEGLPSNLTMTALDYRSVSVLTDSVVYCDIPYAVESKSDRNSQYLRVQFDHQAFFDWAATRDFPVYFSEYKCPDPRFDVVFEKNKDVKMCSTGTKKASETIERLYCNRRGLI